MSALSEQLKASLDRVRAIPGILGLRPYTVSVRVRTWTGERAGLGTKSDSDTSLTVFDGYQPRVRQLTEKDVVASGGLYSDQDFEVMITPAYVGACGIGGYLTTVFDPATGSNPMEVFFNIKGPGLPTTGGWYKKFSQDVSSVLTNTFILRKTAEIND